MPEFITFTLGIDGGNAAFDEDPHNEIARMLHTAADRIAGGESEGKLRDINGNTVGSFDIELGDDEPDEEEENEDQDEAENICQNVEHLYDLGREGGSDALEEAFTAYVTENDVDIDVNNVDFVKLCAFLGDDD